jgi:hypothetical protein
MSGRTLSLVGAIAVVAALCMSGLWLGVPNSARADDCLTAPNSSAPQGSHWYYHIDRASQRKCWHFRAPGEPAQDATAQATSEAAPAAQSPSMPAPFGSTPVTPSSGVDTAPVWPQVPQAASTTDKVVQRSTPSILGTSPPQASTSSPQISAQAGEPAPGPPVAWPDAPPAVGTIKAQESSTVPIGAAADPVHSKAEALASDDADSTARDAEPSTNVWTIRSLRLTPKVFLISALGLTVVGTLFGILMKMAAARRRRLLNDPDSDQLDQATEMMSNETFKTSMAPSTNSNGNNRPNRGRITTPVSHSERATAEPIKTNMAPPMSGKRTTRLNREQVSATVSHSEPTTTGSRDDARDKTEIRKGDDTLAQLNQGLNDLLRAHGSA